MESQIAGNYQKKIKDYVISYCPSEYYGKNFHGQMRSGYQHNQQKVIMFRIAQLPLTPALALFTDIQEHYSELGGFARTVFDPVHSSSNHYQPLEYFPKTFNSQREHFRSNSKYFDEYIEKFLRMYAFFYNMRVAHGNLCLHNIGITFDGRVKLMDFAPNTNNLSFEQRSKADFIQFKQGISVILEKDDNYPVKFSTFNSPTTMNWQHIFSIWHVTSPLEPLYLPRKGYLHNIITVLYKLEATLEEKEGSLELRLALRLLMLKYMQEGKEELEDEKYQLEGVVGKLRDWDCDKMNGVLMGAIQDSQYYGISPEQRLILICCLIPDINHQYALYDIAQEFNSSQGRRNYLLGDSLLSTYFISIKNNLIALNSH